MVSDGIGFEVERFEWTQDDRLEVTGRWYGLRGHRFVRPVLEVQAGDEQRRILALLEHKPWAADDGEQWMAAFPWEGVPVELAAAELAVAPSLAVDLPMPRVPGARTQGPPPPQRPVPARRGAAKPAGEVATEPAGAPAPAGAEELAALRAQLAGERAAVRRLTAELEEARQGLAAAAQAADDHDALERERDAALAARDAALARADLDHDAVVEERDSAVQERSAALYERDEALDERAAANFERESALAERDAAFAQRDAAFAQRDSAFAERDRAVEAHRTAVSVLEAVERRMAEAEQARAAEIASPARAAWPVRSVPGERRERSRSAGLAWAQRAVALIVLIVWAIVVYRVLHGIV